MNIGEETLKHLLEVLALDTIDFEESNIPFDATINPFTHTLSALAPSQKPIQLDDNIPRLNLAHTSEEQHADFEVVKVLGEGGMGRVLLAWQRSLAREVAIKSVKPERANKSAKNALLQEAFFTGTLEHPNIVPVHALGRDASGQPLLVMKRVEGTSWREIIRNQDHNFWKDFSGDPLRRHLEILLQVCNAIHFAHDRGILHRDVKPSNVMIGRFGEVYVLDWGVAVKLSTIKQASSSIFAGTLAYMAPEMLLGDKELSFQTDIYLLGATLHEILAKEPPHQGKNPASILQAVLEKPNHNYQQKIPIELIQICQKAMATEPKERFSTVLSFQKAIENFLHRRGSIELSRAAKEKLEMIQILFFNEGEQPEPVQLHKLFGECRFGFEQALREWPENPQAQVGLEEAITLMVDHEISQRNAGSAKALLAVLKNPNSALQEKLKTLQEQLLKEEKALKTLKNLEFQQDLTVSSLQRGMLVALVAFVYSFVTGVLIWYQRLGVYEESAKSLLWLQLFFSSCVCIAALLTRKVFLRNKANRLIYFVTLAFTGVLTISHIFAAISNISPTHIYIEDMLLWGMFSSMFGVFVSRFFFWNALLFFLCAFFAFLWPDYAAIYLGFGLFPMAFSLFRLWRRTDKENENQRLNAGTLDNKI